EAAGVVDAVGEKVEGFSPGMRVVGHVRGAFAEKAIAPATELLVIPDDISFEVRDYGIDYSSQNVVSEVGKITENVGVQVALDGGGKVTFADCLGTISNNGRIACYGTTTGLDAALPMGKLLGRNIAVDGIALWYSSYYQASWQTLKEVVIPAFVQGKLQSTIEQIVSLEGVSEALTKMEQRSLMGKIVVVP
ncbi:MAG: zinc-binding dehydrogenase, partial [Trichodesmium sp.]